MLLPSGEKRARTGSAPSNASTSCQLSVSQSMTACFLLFVAVSLLPSSANAIEYVLPPRNPLNVTSGRHVAVL